MEDVVDITEFLKSFKTLYVLAILIIGFATTKRKTRRKRASSAPPLSKKLGEDRIHGNEPRKPEPQANTVHPESATKASTLHPKAAAPAPKETRKPPVVDTGDIEEVRKGIIWSVILRQRF